MVIKIYFLRNSKIIKFKNKTKILISSMGKYKKMGRRRGRHVRCQLDSILYGT